MWTGKSTTQYFCLMSNSIVATTDVWQWYLRTQTQCTCWGNGEQTLKAGITSFRRDHFGATYFVAVRLLHKSFRRQFGAVWQFTYLGFGLVLVKNTEYWRRKGPRRKGPRRNGRAEKSWTLKSHALRQLPERQRFRVCLKIGRLYHYS